MFSQKASVRCLNFHQRSLVVSKKYLSSSFGYCYTYRVNNIFSRHPYRDNLKINYKTYITGYRNNRSFGSWHKYLCKSLTEKNDVDHINKEKIDVDKLYKGERSDNDVKASKHEQNHDREININDEKLTSSNIDNNASTGQGNKKLEDMKSLYQKFRHAVTLFMHGGKTLFFDFRRAINIFYKLHIRRHEKTREDVHHMRQTGKDVRKTFPLVLFFFIPIFGYTAPILGYFYPQQLLSQQFWLPEQKKMFALKDFEKKSQYYLPLVKEVGKESKYMKNKELLKLCLKIIDGSQPDNDEILPFKHVFFNELSLKRMPRYHLVKLCKCWLVPNSWYMPRYVLMYFLRTRVTRLHEDDMLILKDSIDMLSPASIEQAVHDRGFYETSLCETARLNWLSDWLKLSTQVTGEDVSFLAHCAVFKAANFEGIENKESLLAATAAEKKLV